MLQDSSEKPVTALGAALLLLLLLLGSCWAQQESLGSGVCLAVVEYSAITGDPVKANKSDIFRGVVRVEDQVEEWTPRSSQLSWSFTRGETILGGDTVFRENAEDSNEDGGDIKFTSSTTESKQSVEMNYFADDKIVNIGFVASKGASARPDSDINVRRSTGLPVSLEYNGLLCEKSDERSNQQFQSTEDSAEVTRGNNIVELEYLPIEFTQMRFDTGYASNFAIFTFRLLNNGSSPIDLSDLVLEYWFDGGNAQGKPPNAMFNSHCMTSTIIDCSQFKVSVMPGLEKVSGAHYKIAIGFEKESGVLVPAKQPLPLAIDSAGNQVEERPPSMIEAILNITSAQVFSQIDVTKDYSFLNTTILDEDHNLPEELVSRQYELNPKIPVLMNGEIIFGNRPKPSQEKAPSDTSNQNNCWYKKPGIRQCGVRARYCCQEEAVKSPHSKNTLNRWMIVVGVAAITVLIFLSVYIFCRWWCHDGNPHRTKCASELVILDQGRFGSDAGSIIDGELYVKPDSFPYEELDGSVGQHSSTKFHTVPSFVGINALMLDPSMMEWDPREEKTWTGHINWYWEPWNEAEVRRTSTAIPAQSTSPGSLLTMSTKCFQKIDVHVDYRAEIEPNLNYQLGEGGFGKVFKATFRGKDVAVKVLKVDTDAMIKNLEDEIKLSSKMHNEHVVKLLGACLGNKDNVCLIMELVDGGNLSTRIHNKNQRRLEYIEVLNIGLDIVRGLAYLHPTVIHRDLKPQNVLLSKEGRCKIADFGISKFKDPHKSYLSVTQTGGTPNYMAPELFNGTRVDEKCDIFSLGCILYEAMARRVPLSDLQGENCAPLFQIIKTVAIDKRRPKIPETFPADLADLIRSCWKDNPRSRPSATDVAKQLERMIDDEVERVRMLWESAQKKDSTISTNSADRRSPVLEMLGGRFQRQEPLPSPDGRRLPDSNDGGLKKPKLKRKANVPQEAKLQQPLLGVQRTVELETYHSAKSLEYFSVEDTGRVEVRGNNSQLERALSGNQDSIYSDPQESPHTRTGSSSSIITPRSAGSKESRRTKSKKERSKPDKVPGKAPDLICVEEELEAPSRAISSDRLSLGSYAVNATYGQFEEDCCENKPVARKASNSRFNDMSKLELDGSFQAELADFQRRVNTHS